MWRVGLGGADEFCFYYSYAAYISVFSSVLYIKLTLHTLVQVKLGLAPGLNGVMYFDLTL